MYPSWNNKVIKDITDPQYNSMVQNAIKSLNNEINKSNIFNEFLFFDTCDWVFGKKGYLNIVFKKDNKFYTFGSGANLQVLGNNFNDTNIQNFCICQTILTEFELE